jgi:hypothetical protein
MGDPGRRDAGMVERLAEALGPAARIQIDGDARFLIRPEWQEASDAHEVEALGHALLKRANGLMRIGGEFVAPPDLYKVYEFARNGLGGQAEVDALIGPKPRRRLTQTMNHYRHARVKGPPLPPDPPSFNDAVAEVGQLVEAWLPRR